MGSVVPLPSQLRVLEERRKLPQWGPVFVHFQLERILMATNFVFLGRPCTVVTGGLIKC